MKKDGHIRVKEAWVLFFLLGVVMLNYPFLHIFNKGYLILGIPMLVLYFMIGWPFSIFIIFLFAKTTRDNGPPHSQFDKRKGPGSE